MHSDIIRKAVLPELTVRYVKDNEYLVPDIVDIKYVDYTPIYATRSYAIYELYPGEFYVYKRGIEKGQPYVSTDFSLAKLVCQQWSMIDDA